MTTQTQTKKYSISFPARSHTKHAPRSVFYELAKKHIIKGKAGGSRDLSKRVDKVAYRL